MLAQAYKFIKAPNVSGWLVRLYISDWLDEFQDLSKLTDWVRLYACHVIL
jgi:hypothetical protein